MGKGHDQGHTAHWLRMFRLDDDTLYEAVEQIEQE